MKRIIIVIIVCLLFVNELWAQNPIVPPGVYIADPSAKVFPDGKLYIYGSLDESCNYYCSWRHHVMVTDDLLNWTISENIFSSKGNNDQVAYNDQLLFAPDATYYKGKYYLYYCQPSRETAEGVAIADAPTGPFANGQKLELGGHEQIDPAIFTDDDGQVYYLWGQFALKMAKMKDNMTELDLNTLKDSVLTEEEHFFHEGAFLTKRNGLYYLVYADISRADMPTSIGYAVSEKPFGPYRYGGVIVDNNHCNPNNWNNHGSIAKFKGQWYVFYHRSTHACSKMRKACIEPIEFLDDGSIPEVEMTSQGAAGPLPATQKIQAEQACLLHGNLYIELFEDNNEQLTNISNGEKAIYKYIDFNNEVNQLTMRLKQSAQGGRIAIAIDKPWHRHIATIDLPERDDATDWQEITVPIDKVEGIHAVWLVFYGKGEALFQIDWFQFSKN